MAAESGEKVYFVVNNIPVKLRSADLRNYFSQFTESGGFSCFHYRHRREVKITAGNVENNPKHSEEKAEEVEEDGKRKTTGGTGGTGATGGTGGTSCCCVVCVKGSEAERFVKMYSGNQWIDSKGNWLSSRCLIRRVKVSINTDPDVFPYKTKAELRRSLAHTEHFTESDLLQMPELHPPALMPAGNVGTPVSVFLQLIQSCRFPPRLIRKLGLSFPKTQSHRRYGNVPYHYNTPLVEASEESVFTAAGVEIRGPGSIELPKSAEKPKDGTDKKKERPIRAERPRHEALHEDVTSQERIKERLFEEEIELKWEKGGSGLVFYTDAQYWQEEEEGDFDEQTADDWDVDMSVYYENDGGDMDSRDYVRMRHEQRLRDGTEQKIHQQRIGTFERFTKGMGRRMMEKQGWRDGEGLGHSRAGIAEALEAEGQKPNCRRGFGYHGEKLSSFQPLKKPRPEFHISTVYDQPKESDGGDTLLRRQPSTSMKYTHWHWEKNSKKHS
ncbi:G patch domain-containing protein 3 [Bagarius yarrelli]|uniref:G patch domain-containing protein 3 n=1 Tax=Bagarius yarrelli TaxID=175774 RepID=A0A556TLM8_BAGYA|nr:G patch domain-containing protein 3 [Bagarius yarrelli]